MKRKSFNLLFIGLVIMVSSCELFIPDHMIAVVNNSDSDIYCRWTTSYPDTLDIEYHTVVNDSYSKVSAHSSLDNIIVGRYDAISVIKSIPTDTLLVFVLDATTIDSIGDDLVNSWMPLYKSMDDKQLYDWLVIKKYVLSEEDWERMDWTITYP